MENLESISESEVGHLTESLNIDSLDGCPGLVVIKPSKFESDLEEFITAYKDKIECFLHKHGAVLFRGFPVENANKFSGVVSSWESEILSYTYRSTPRSEISKDIYTSTEYPADLTIQQHNEHSYTNSWPKELWFYCDDDRFDGGETPLADSRKVYNSIPREIREKFNTKNLMYVRNYSEFLDIPWQKVFQTTSKEAVQHYCDNNSIQYEWDYENKTLRTAQIGASVIKHPDTGESVWFNQAHLFHYSGADADLKDMLDSIGLKMPRNVYFEDFDDIPTEYLDEIRTAYESNKQSFKWKKGDVLLVENMLMTHGRNPYSGSRKILVAMTNETNSMSISKPSNSDYRTNVER